MVFLDRFSNVPEGHLSERSLKLKSYSLCPSFSLLHFPALGQNRKIRNLVLVDLDFLSLLRGNAMQKRDYFCVSTHNIFLVSSEMEDHRAGKLLFNFNFIFPGSDVNEIFSLTLPASCISES